MFRKQQPQTSGLYQLYSFVSNLTQNYPYSVAEVLPGSIKVILFQCISENSLIPEVDSSQKSVHELWSSMKLYVSHNQSCGVSLHHEYIINDQCHPKSVSVIFSSPHELYHFKSPIMLGCYLLCYQFPVMAITSYHKPGGIEQGKSILSQCWGPKSEYFSQVKISLKF